MFCLQYHNPGFVSQSVCVCMCKPVLYIKAVSASDIGLSALDGDEDVIFLNSFWAL